MGLSLANCSEMLRVRRDAFLDPPSQLLLPSSKEPLRTAPLNSPLLFGGRIKEVSQADKEEQIHASVARPPWRKPSGTKRPSTSESGVSASKKSKHQKKSQPQPPAPSGGGYRRFSSAGRSRGRGRGRGNSSRQPPPLMYSSVKPQTGAPGFQP